MPIRRITVIFRYLPGTRRPKSSVQKKSRSTPLSDKEIKILDGFEIDYTAVSGRSESLAKLNGITLLTGEAHTLITVLTRASRLIESQLGKDSRERSQLEVVVKGFLSEHARGLLEEAVSRLESEEVFRARAQFAVRENASSPVSESVSITARREAAKRIGPFFNPVSLRAYLGLRSIDEFTSWAKATDVLQVFSAEDLIGYPAFQFREGGLDPRYETVLHEFNGADISGWAIADWFTMPQVVLKNSSPRDWLNANNSAEPVVIAAREYVAHRGRP